jgi:hypothetical protein
MWLNMFLLAVVGIVCFLLAVLPATPFCYEFPMGAVGKIYASSMLVLLNSRMILGSEEASSTTVSVLKFGTMDNNKGHRASESYISGSFSADTEEWAGASRRSETGAVRKVTFS